MDSKDVIMGIILMVGIMVLAGSASANRVVNDVKVNGANNVTVIGSTTVNVSVTVSTNGYSDHDWKSTSYQIEGGNSTCVNTADHTSQSTFTETFSITTPAAAGTYDLLIKAYSDNSCSSGGSSTSTKSNAIRVVQCLTGSCCNTTSYTFKTPGTSCSDGAFCNGAETCNGNGSCVSGTAVSCSSNNVTGIASCDNVPDADPKTWDYRAAFTSTCDENSDSCTIGSNVIAHTFEIGKCGVSCSSDSDCSNLTQNYCDKLVYKQDTGKCVEHVCSAETSEKDCDDNDDSTTDTCESTGCVNSKVIENNDGGSIDFGPGSGKAFEDNENVIIIGSGWGCDSVNVYITKDQNWNTNPVIVEKVKSFTGVDVSNGEFNLTWAAAETQKGKYDVLAECDGSENTAEEYEPAKGDVVDGITIEGFEVLPEVVTGVLLIAGLVSMVAYTTVNKR